MLCRPPKMETLMISWKIEIETFPVVRYFKWKVKFVVNILWMIVDLSNINKQKKQQKNSCSTYYSLNVYLLIFHSCLAIHLIYHDYLQFPCNWIASYRKYLSSSLQYCRTMPRKFKRSGKNRFGVSEKDPYFLNIPKWQHKLVQEYKQGKLFSYFLEVVARRWSNGLKISKNIEIKYFFQSKTPFPSH